MSASNVRTQQEEPNVNRDASGRFAFGNPGGPGNPFARRVAELRKAMLHAVSDEDIAQIIVALMQKAKEGNVQAARLVLSYTLGKPDKVHDPDQMDVEEWELQKDTAAMYDTMPQVLKAPPAALPLHNARLLRPLVGSIIQGEIADMFTVKEEKPSTNDVLEKEQQSVGQASGLPEQERAPYPDGQAGGLPHGPTPNGHFHEPSDYMERAREELWEEMKRTREDLWEEMKRKGYVEHSADGNQTGKSEVSMGEGGRF